MSDLVMKIVIDVDEYELLGRRRENYDGGESPWNYLVWTKS